MPRNITILKVMMKMMVSSRQTTMVIILTKKKGNWRRFRKTLSKIMGLVVKIVIKAVTQNPVMSRFKRTPIGKSGSRRPLSRGSKSRKI